MAPPPEPMASTRSVGTLIGWWLMTVVVARTGSPSTTSPARNVVPPTSVEMMLRWPSWRPSATDPTTPPVRTDPTVLIAEAGASCGGDGAAAGLHHEQRTGQLAFAQRGFQ